jgi:hypothetical protein
MIVRAVKATEDNSRVCPSFAATWRELIWAVSGTGCALQHKRIAAYEKEILRKLGEMEEPGQGTNGAPLNNANKAQAIKKRGQEPKRQALYRMSGVDITQIDAIGVETVEVVMSEYGPDPSRLRRRSSCRTSRWRPVCQGAGADH